MFMKRSIWFWLCFIISVILAVYFASRVIMVGMGRGSISRVRNISITADKNNKDLSALAVAAVFAYIVNRLIPGANYLYMARPEAAPSILDILPPNFALRLLIMAAVITLLYALAYLPWYLKDKKKAQ